jgi:hypothetical protein
MPAPAGVSAGAGKRQARVPGIATVMIREAERISDLGPATGWGAAKTGRRPAGSVSCPAVFHRRGARRHPLLCACGPRHQAGRKLAQSGSYFSAISPAATPPLLRNPAVGACLSHTARTSQAAGTASRYGRPINHAALALSGAQGGPRRIWPEPCWNTILSQGKQRCGCRLPPGACLSRL